MDTYACVHIDPYMHACTGAYKNTTRLACMHACMYAHVYTHAYIWYICMHTRACKHTCIYGTYLKKTPNRNRSHTHKYTHTHTHIVKTERRDWEGGGSLPALAASPTARARGRPRKTIIFHWPAQPVSYTCICTCVINYCVIFVIFVL